MIKPSRIKSLLLAVLVTMIWATSWVLIKIGLEDVPAMTFAGLRYTLASILLWPFLLRKNVRAEIRSLTRKDWIKLIILGVFLYTVAQGGQYLGLAYLPTVTVSLILNLSALFVALMSTFAIKEKPHWLQWIGIFLNLFGILIYFYPASVNGGSWWGWFFAVLSLFGNIIGAIIGRKVNRTAHINPIVITAISMSIGSVLMLTSGILWQGFPPLTSKSIWIIVILAVVNTAFCFSVWNFVQQTLTATETTIINSSMLVYIAILAWIFLGEKQSAQGIIGLLLVLTGAMIVQIRFTHPLKS
ncbi:MAG: hypothetical protein C0401_07125 [Anaerolinea sp.]|nr:hypothetical protein [Anaerolinea sp.]